MKTTARKSLYRKDMKRYIKTCKSRYIPNYSGLHLAQFIDSQPRPTDITYYIDDAGRLIRNKITIKTYSEKG